MRLLRDRKLMDSNCMASEKAAKAILAMVHYKPLNKEPRWVLRANCKDAKGR